MDWCRTTTRIHRGHRTRPSEEQVRGRAHATQRARAALRPAGVARAAAVAQEVDVELELLAGRGEREHLVVELVEAGARGEEVQAGADARDVRVHRDVAPPDGEEQHARGGPLSHPGEP